ncbi:unnamed protein product [Thelazia callipaeda]|uniref:VWFA domain-containing protein n=1 Tax=Thelazia callipaeda TaxID=103827 RepID=A0A0N5CYR1_THECL|nr:unnamed protein product [Thelazia callipaeda]
MCGEATKLNDTNYISECEKDALFVIDSTSSVRRYFEDHRAYAVEVIKAILPDDDQTTRIGELPFFAGITATGAALDLALNVLQERRPNAITNVIIITDGFRYVISNIEK